jgi:hypothetical protein
MTSRRMRHLINVCGLSRKVVFCVKGIREPATRKRVGEKTEVFPMRSLIVALLILVPSLATAQMPGGIGPSVGGTVRGAVSGGLSGVSPRVVQPQPTVRRDCTTGQCTTRAVRRHQR